MNRIENHTSEEGVEAKSSLPQVSLRRMLAELGKPITAGKAHKVIFYEEVDRNKSGKNYDVVKMTSFGRRLLAGRTKNPDDFDSRLPYLAANDFPKNYIPGLGEQERMNVSFKPVDRLKGL